MFDREVHFAGAVRKAVDNIIRTLGWTAEHLTGAHIRIGDPQGPGEKEEEQKKGLGIAVETL